MSTTTTVERMPCNWDSGDSMGEWPEGTNPGAAWRRAFDAYVSEKYPPCSLVGDEIYGPATYRFPHCEMQRDTTPVSELIPLPDGGIYAEFQALHQDDWCDVIEQYITEAK